MNAIHLNFFILHFFLDNDHKKLLQQIQELKNDILVNSTATGDGSTNCTDKENQVSIIISY